MSRKLSFFYDIMLKFDEPVKEHAFTLRCLPPSFPGQEILDMSLELEPHVPYIRQHDSFGNLLQIGYIKKEHNYFRYTARGTAKIDISLRRPEISLPIFHLPSAYTTPSKDMQNFFKTLKLPHNQTELAWYLMQVIQQHMTYTAGVTNPSTTAAQAFALSKGVCQDYAHIYLALARMAGLKARYANGLPEGEGTSHAWCEVLLDGIWKGIDPTRGQWTDDSYIRFGTGRDFGDCPIERGIFLGCTNQTQTVFMKVAQQ